MAIGRRRLEELGIDEEDCENHAAGNEEEVEQDELSGAELMQTVIR